MNIGLDYGGVIDFDVSAWNSAVKACNKSGHKVFLISHAQEGEDAEKRALFCKNSDCTNLTFMDLKSGLQEVEIATRKSELIRDHKIDLFIDDDLSRVVVAGIMSSTCACFYVPQSKWMIGLKLIESYGGVE